MQALVGSALGSLFSSGGGSSEESGGGGIAAKIGGSMAGQAANKVMNAAGQVASDYYDFKGMDTLGFKPEDRFSTKEEIYKTEKFNEIARANMKKMAQMEFDRGSTLIQTNDQDRRAAEEAFKAKKGYTYNPNKPRDIRSLFGMDKNPNLDKDKGEFEEMMKENAKSRIKKDFQYFNELETDRIRNIGLTNLEFQKKQAELQLAVKERDKYLDDAFQNRAPGVRYAPQSVGSLDGLGGGQINYGHIGGSDNPLDKAASFGTLRDRYVQAKVMSSTEKK